jgi:diguanylate cyclase (GGDEF)-like protein
VQAQAKSGRRDEFVDSVAELTDSRDREALEITLASVMSELVEASTFTLWRVVQRGGVMMLRQRVRLGASGAMIGCDEATVDSSQLLPLEAHPDLEACYNAKLSLRPPPGENGMPRHVFPVSSGRDVVWLLEILSASPLSREQERLVFGMLRIFRNHVGVLDYGDCDDLTGLLNRRTFDESFRRILSLGQAGGETKKYISGDCRRPPRRKPRTHFAVLDIDFFKRVNDRFGHPYGDEVLVLFSRLMGEYFRDTDRLFRFGGEEFVVMLSDVSLREAERALERFRAAVETFRFPQVGQITVSIGFTSIRGGDNGSTAFGRADAALYVAKHSGRNRIMSYEKLAANGDIAVEKGVVHDVELF